MNRLYLHFGPGFLGNLAHKVVQPAFSLQRDVVPGADDCACTVACTRSYIRM